MSPGNWRQLRRGLNPTGKNEPEDSAEQSPRRRNDHRNPHNSGSWGQSFFQPSGWDNKDTFKQKREETELQLRCEGGRCWDLPKRHWKTGSQHQLTQLLFSCQTNTNRQLGLWLAWIQIEDETHSGNTHQGNMPERLRSRGKREGVRKLASKV